MESSEILPPAMALRRLLDPRPVEEARRRPVCNAVNIPLAELTQRTSELPSRQDVINVAGSWELTAQTITWLREHGRQARAVADYEYDTDHHEPQPGRLWQPSSLLLEVLPQLQPVAALDLACGTGRDAVYLAGAGWDVTAADILPDALDRGRELAGRYAAVLSPICWLVVDFEAGAVNFAHGFDLICMFRYLHRPLFAQLARWLKPGGSILCETFTTLHRERHGKPARDAHVLQIGELPDLLKDYEIRLFSEQWHGDRHTARAWATRPPT
ncbi:MAG: methyltransferase domain-containing protein [Planctomycetota bacterium]